jgi:hypothetical protein
MASVTAPVDGRPQFDPATVWAANAMSGRWITDGVETMTPGGKYILANSWPKPKANGFSSSVTPRPPMSGLASSPTPEPRPMTPARAIWPNLP